MPLRFEIQLDGHRKLLDTAKTLDREMVKGIRQAVQTSARELRNEARGAVPKFSGNMRQAIKYRSWGQYLSATVFVDRRIAPHTHLVIRGRSPGGRPSTQDARLQAWAAQKGVNVYALVRSMASQGTRPAVAGDFMVQAMNNQRGTIIERIRQAFIQAFRRP